MEFENKMPDWLNKGDEPSPDLKTNGFVGEQRVPANFMNWFMALFADAIAEIQKKMYASFAPIPATSTDGTNYTCNIEGVTELYDGMTITIVPNMTNASNTVRLNLNGLGLKNVRRPLSFSTYVANAPEANFLHAGTACRLMFHGSYASGGTWLLIDKVKYSAQDLYGVVPKEDGGTGIDSTAVNKLATQLTNETITEDEYEESMKALVCEAIGAASVGEMNALLETVFPRMTQVESDIETLQSVYGQHSTSIASLRSDLTATEAIVENNALAVNDLMERVNALENK